jgi:hypothetical protein
MITFILLAVIAGETFWLYRLGALRALAASATTATAAVFAAASAFHDHAATLLRGWLS